MAHDYTLTLVHKGKQIKLIFKKTYFTSIFDYYIKVKIFICSIFLHNFMWIPNMD